MCLEYKYTCPDIEEQVDNIKHGLKDFVNNLLTKYAPDIKGDFKKTIVKEQSKLAYNDYIVNCIENVRKTNTELRKEAERQIETADSNVSELEDKIDELEEIIVDLEKELSLCSIE
jgi:chromosome segregation ATPase